MLSSNFLKEIRENKLMSKAELSRKAGISTHTIDRIEKGRPCRIDTKRKIILALGFELSEKTKYFFRNNDHRPECNTPGWLQHTGIVYRLVVITKATGT